MNKDFEINIPLTQERILEIIYKFIADTMKKHILPDEQELDRLTCTELITLISSTNSYVEKVMVGIETHFSKSVKYCFLKAIKKKLENDNVYVLWSSMINLPFLYGGNFPLIYTNKAKADESAEYFTELFKEEKIIISVKEYGNKAEMWNLIAICGMNKILIDGGNIVFELKQFYDAPYSEFGNICPDLAFILHQYKVILKTNGYGANANKFECIQELITENLKFSKMLMAVNFEGGSSLFEEGTIVNMPLVTMSDGTKMQPLFTDQLAINNYFKSTNQSSVSGETVSMVYKLIEINNSISGIIINPGREEFILTKPTIEKMILVSKEALSELKAKPKFYSLYLKISDMEVPSIISDGSVFLCTDKTLVTKELKKSTQEAFIREFDNSELPAFMNYCRKNGIRKINYKSDSSIIIEVAEYFGNNVKFAGAELSQKIIRFLEADKNKSKSGYANIAQALKVSLHKEIVKTPFLVPIVYEDEDDKSPVKDDVLHISEGTLENFTCQYLFDKTEISDDEKIEFLKTLKFYGAEGYHFSDEKVNKEKKMNVRAVNNGIHVFIPAFTDVKTLQNIFGKNTRIGIMSFDELTEFLNRGAFRDVSKSISGIVLNPTGACLALNREEINIIKSGNIQPINNQEKFNPLCTASMVLGIIGLFSFSFGLPNIAAIILGFFGYKKSKSKQQPGANRAVIGIGLGILGIILSIWFWIEVALQ